MPTYFHGWRRKAGCVMLVMALWLTASWITCRGEWSVDPQGDTFSLRNGKNSSDVYILGCGETRWISLNGSLIWTSRYKGDSDGAKFFYSDVFPNYAPGSFFEFSEFEWRWQSCGFGAGYLNELVIGGLAPNPFWIVPYWSLVIPLALLSAYLLFNKRRPTISETR